MRGKFEQLYPVSRIYANTGCRDEAMRQTRKLQADILAEREKVKALMASN